MPASELQSGYASDSEQEASPGGGKPFKRRRRLHGACDACKRKKTKCDSAIMANNVCSNCINAKVECTRTIPRQKKRDRQQEYILHLEEKLRKMEELLETAQVSVDAHSSPSSSTQESSELQQPPHHSLRQLSTDIPLPIPQTLASSSPQTNIKEEYDSDEYTALAEQLGRLSVACDDKRFFGKSSILSFASQAATRNGLTKPDESFNPIRRPPFWDIRQWEREYIRAEQHTYVFPEPDLLNILFEAYKDRVHPQLPVLHWPSFLRDVQNGRHLQDQGFGRVVLAVCATSSRYVEDERVLIIDNEYPELSGSSAGWMFISQTPLFRRMMIERSDTTDLQYYALAVFYYLGTSSPQTAWNLIGLATRLAIDRGLHRRKASSPRPTSQEELEKRIFWTLLCLEWMTSTSLGRPSCLHEEDIDVEYPIECDDEYWDTEVDDPSKAFQQPPGKPSMITAMTFHLKLCEMAAFMTRTLYSTKKSKLLTGTIGEQWEMRIISELDSSMNKWKDALPQHLRWDPNTPDESHFNQQSLLHAGFYYLQIQIHRPFLQSNSVLSLPGLAMCTNAARACSHIAQASLKRQRFTSIHLLSAALTASTVLMVNLWGRNGKPSYSIHKEVEDIQALLNFLRSGERRWYLAGRFVDMVTQFCSLRGVPTLPVPESSSSVSRKRTRDDSSSSLSAQVSTLPPQWTTFPPQETGLTQAPESLSAGPSSVQPPLATDDSPQLEETAPQFNPDWDLTSLLLAQLGYAGNLGNPQVADPNHEVPADTQLDFSMTDQSVPPVTFDPSAMSFWMAAPTAFSIEEWDNYMANLNSQPLPSGGGMQYGA